MVDLCPRVEGIGCQDFAGRGREIVVEKVGKLARWCSSRYADKMQFGRIAPRELARKKRRLAALRVTQTTKRSLAALLAIRRAARTASSTERPSLMPTR